MSVRGDTQNLTNSVVDVDPLRDMEGLDGDAGPECLHHRVAPGHGLRPGRSTAAGPHASATSIRRLSPARSAVGPPRLRLTGAVFGARSRTFAFERFAPLPTGSDDHALLAARLAGSATPSGVTGHRRPTPSGDRPECPRRRRQLP